MSHSHWTITAITLTLSALCILLVSTIGLHAPASAHVASHDSTKGMVDAPALAAATTEPTRSAPLAAPTAQPANISAVDAPATGLLRAPALAAPANGLAAPAAPPVLATPTVEPAAPVSAAAQESRFAVPGTVGVDVSFPQCGRLDVPAVASNGAPYSFAIIGVNHGRPFTQNACLADEYQALAARGMALGFVMNLSSPRPLSSTPAQSGPAGTCAVGDDVCSSYNYGWNAAQDAYTYTQDTLRGIGVIDLPRVWLMDIEVTNYWSRDHSLNDQVLQGAIDYLTKVTGYSAADSSGSGVTSLVGVYSSTTQWVQIAGSSFRPAAAGWLAGARSLSMANRLCSRPLMGGPTQMVQHVNGTLDEDYAC